MKKIFKFCLILVVIALIFGGLKTDLFKEIYVKIYELFSPENVNKLIDKAAEATDEIATSIKQSGIIEEAQKTLEKGIESAADTTHKVLEDALQEVEDAE